MSDVLGGCEALRALGEQYATQQSCVRIAAVRDGSLPNEDVAVSRKRVVEGVKPSVTRLSCATKTSHSSFTSVVEVVVAMSLNIVH